MGSAGRAAYLCRALTARHRDDVSSSATAIGISHHVGTVVVASAAVRPRAAMTPAAMLTCLCHAIQHNEYTGVWGGHIIERGRITP